MALERQHFWGVTLSDKKREAKWSADNDDVEAEVDILNQLAVSQACLGSKATGTHVVEVTTKGINDNMITQPICVLQKGVIQQQLRLEFSSSATFKLAEGDGPVHLAGSHIQVLSSAFSDSDEDSEDEGIASHNQLPSGAKPQKTSISPAGKQPPTKKTKMDLLNDEESESEEESMPVLVPIKDKRKKPVLAKSDNQKKASKKDDKPKEKEGLLDNEAEEESEDEEEDDDFEMESDELEMGSDEDDDEDEDDEDDDDDEDDEEEDDEDEEKDSKVSKFKQKGTPSRAVNGQMAGKTPDKKTPNKKPQANTPKGKKPEAVQKTPKSDGPLDIDSIKQKLLKSPNLPKKVDKFKNFLRTNLKVTEDQTVNELWKWLQKNKK